MPLSKQSGSGAARRKTHSHKKKDDDGALEALFLFLSRGRRNDKTFLVFRRQASHSILSNFIRERRRTRSYIGRKDISCSCRELPKVEEGFLAVLGICQHSRQGVRHDILAQSISKPANSYCPTLYVEKERPAVRMEHVPSKARKMAPPAIQYVAFSSAEN